MVQSLVDPAMRGRKETLVHQNQVCRLVFALPRDRQWPVPRCGRARPRLVRTEMSKSLLKRPRRAPAILAAERSTRTGLKRPRGTLSAVPLDLIVRGKRFLRRINPIGETGDGERSFSGARSELPGPRRPHDGFVHVAASPTNVSAGLNTY